MFWGCNKTLVFVGSLSLSSIGWVFGVSSGTDGKRSITASILSSDATVVLFGVDKSLTGGLYVEGDFGWSSLVPEVVGDLGGPLILDGAGDCGIAGFSISNSRKFNFLACFTHAS